MQQNNKFKRALCNICGELIVLVTPRTLSTLHLSCYHKSYVIKEKKELLKLSKRMLKIANRFFENDLEKANQMQNNIELFYDLYNRRDCLTLKELKLLRNFYDLLRHNHCFPATESCETIKDYEYSETIDDLIDEKRYKK